MKLQPNLEEVLRLLGAEGRTTVGRLTKKVQEVVVKGGGRAGRERKMEAEELVYKLFPGVSHTK